MPTHEVTTLPSNLIPRTLYDVSLSFVDDNGNQQQRGPGVSAAYAYENKGGAIDKKRLVEKIDAKGGLLEGDLVPHLVRKNGTVMTCVSDMPDAKISLPPVLVAAQMQRLMAMMEFMCERVVPLVDNLSALAFPDEPSILGAMLDKHRDDMEPAHLPFPVRHDPLHPTPQDVNDATYEKCRLVIATEKAALQSRKRERDERFDLLKREAGAIRAIASTFKENQSLPDVAEVKGNQLGDISWLDMDMELPVVNDADFSNMEKKMRVVELVRSLNEDLNYVYKNEKTGTVYTESDAHSMADSGKAKLVNVGDELFSFDAFE